MRSLWTAQDRTGTVRCCSRSLLLPCHCCPRPPASGLPVPRAVRLCHSRGPAETSAVAVGVARGTPRPPFFEGCSPSPLAPSYASATAADVSVAENVGAASASAKRRSSKGKGGKGGGGGSGGSGGGSSGGGGGGRTGGGSGGSGGGSGGSGGSGSSGGGGTSDGGTKARRVGLGVGQREQQQRRSETQSPQQLREWFLRGVSGGSCPYVIRTGDCACQTCGKLHTQHRCFSRLDDAWRAEFGDDVELPHWADLLRSRIDIFDLDFDAIIFAMYALSVSAEGDCYRCVPPDRGIAATSLGASESGTLPRTAPTQVLHTFTLDSGASACFFHDSTTLTPLSTRVPVRLADPSGGPIVARSSTVLPCPAIPSGSLSGLHLPSFSTNLVSTAALQDAMVTTTTRVTICTCTRTRRHLATFTRRPGSSLYTLATEPPQVAAYAQVFASGQVAASCLCRLLSHQTLLWHHRLGHPSLSRLCGMHSCLLVSGLPRSLPPLPPSPAPPCLPCVEGRQRAAPHSSSFPPMTAPLQTLHMDVWGPARVSGQSSERYFLLVVDDYTRYTTVFPLRSKGQVVDVLIPWIRTVRLQLRERFGQDLPVLRLHSDRGGEFSSTLLRDFCRGEGILQSFKLPDSPQQNEIAEHRIGLVMEVARTSMIHVAAPHFLWPFAVWYAAHQLNLWPRVSLPETSPTLHWTGEVSDASVFWVWGSCAFVRDTSVDKLSARAIPCIFLGFVPDTPGWQFYYPTSRSVFPSQDVTFDESVPFYRLFPYRSAPPPPPLLFLAPGPPPVDPLPPQGPAPSGAACGGAASRGAELGGAESEGAETGGAEPGRVKTGGAEPGGAEPEGVEPGGAASEGAESEGAEPLGAASSGGSAGASLRLSPQQLREWFVRRARLQNGATGAGGAGAARAGGARVAIGAGVTGGTAATGPGGARTRGAGAAGSGGVKSAGAGDPMASGATGTGGSGAGGTRAGGAGVGGTGAGGAGVGDTGAGGAGAGGVAPGGAVRSRPYFVPLLQQVLGTPSSTGLTPPLLCPPPDRSQPPLQPPSPLPAPSPYTEQFGGLAKRRQPASRPVSPVRTSRGVPRLRPPPVPSTHAMTLRPSSVPLRVPLPTPPASSLPEVPDHESDRSRAASPTLSRLLATTVTDPSFASTTASALVAELLDFAAACRLDYATAPIAESASASPPSVGGKCALGTDVLEDRQEDFACLAAAVPCFASMLLAPEGDPDAPDIPTPRSYGEAITGTYVDKVPPPGANIVDGMWIFRVKRPPGSPPAFKARYVARGFSQRQGVDYFHTFSPTSKMTTLRVLCGVFGSQSTVSARRLVRTTLAALGFAPATADPSLQPFYVLVYVDDLVFATADTEALTLVLQRFGFQFSSPQPTPLFTGHSLSAPPSNKSVEPSGLYPELVGCLMYLMTCTRPDLAYPLSLLARYVAPGRHRKMHWDAAKRVLRYLCSTLGMGLVLGGRGPVVLTGHADASWVDNSATQWTSHGYTFSFGAMAAQELRWLTYLLTDLGEQPRSPPVLFAWLTKQHQSPLQFNFTLTELPPRLVSSLMRSCLFPSLSSITSFDLYLSRSIPSHPCLLYSLSQAPCLESLLIEHGIGLDSDRDVPRKHCNDPVMVAEMLEIISIMEEANKNYKDRPFPVMRRLRLYLSACSPLILRFIFAQLHSLDLAAEDQFAALEGKEGAISSENARERDAGIRSSFSLDLSAASDVRLNGLNCSISLSAPRLFSLCFQWQSRDSRLLLLPTCPAHVTSLFLQTDPICPWALHVPHLTSLHSLCTDMDLEQATCLPPGVIETVKVLERRNPMDSQSLDLSAWHGLRCLHAVGWAPVSLSVFRSAEVWSCDLEGMFFSSIGSKVVGFLESGLGGGGGGESLGTSHGGEGTSRDRGDVSMETGGCLTLAEEGSHSDARNGDADQDNGRKLLAQLLPGCRSLQRFEGWHGEECVLYVLYACRA
ncbi:unnamed protein product [Closterium sp. NIES-54]